MFRFPGKRPAHGEKTRRTAAAFAPFAAASLTAAVLTAVMLFSTPVLAGEVLMSRSGLDNWLWKKLLPWEQRLDRVEDRAQAAETKLTAWKDAHLCRIYLWPDNPVVEYFDPGGIPTGTANLDVPPQIVNGRTMVPLRFIGEALGAEVVWDGNTRQVVYTAGDRLVVLTVGQTTALAGGMQVGIDAPPTIINGRTMVPVRFVSQWMGAVVKWDAAAKRVEISYRKDGPGNEGTAG